MKERFVLITKDATCKCYLPVYGRGNSKMPNLMELASKGTIFDSFYTAAPSTAMSFIAFSTQKYPYQTNHSDYVEVKEQEKNTIFDKLYDAGYNCHIIWEEKWVAMAKKYSQCYGEHSQFHLIHINQVVGAHNNDFKNIICDENQCRKTLEIIRNEIDNVSKATDGKLFLWIHLPHVLLGRNCYGSDEDMFDEVIGFLRVYFDDDAIYISSDHGNMNGTKGKVSYGFDVYQSAINIPLVTPRIDGLERCNIPLSNIHLFDLFNNTVPKDEFVYSDTAYYGQAHRKLAIIHGRYKYIFNKLTRSEELYDIEFDPHEDCNLIDRLVKDEDRHLLTPLDQVYYYPRWRELELEKILLRKEFNRIWRTGTVVQECTSRIKVFFQRFTNIYHFLSRVKNRK